jgi:hypothetical protein
VAAGLRTTITMVLLRHNLTDAPALVRLAATSASRTCICSGRIVAAAC